MINYEKPIKKDWGSGADWVSKVTKKEMSFLGRRFADMIGDVFSGIYHLEEAYILKADWNNERKITLPIYAPGIASYDMPQLTFLIFLARMYAIDISIRPYSKYRIKICAKPEGKKLLNPFCIPHKTTMWNMIGSEFGAYIDGLFLSKNEFDQVIISGLDFNQLVYLIYSAFENINRVELNAKSNHRLELFFHGRKKREGRLGERIPEYNYMINRFCHWAGVKITWIRPFHPQIS